MIVGLPRMHMETGEKRDFLPDLVGFIDRAGADRIVLEQGYGLGMDVPEAEYLAASDKVTFGSYDECLSADLVLVLRCPPAEALKKMRPGAALLSMLHYKTHVERTALLNKLGIRAVSLDQIVDENGNRRVQNMRAVAWNGVGAAFREIAKMHEGYSRPGRKPVRVTVLGAGQVGGQVVFAATHYGDPEVRKHMFQLRVPGVEVTVVDYDLTWHRDYMVERLAQTDLLVDATARLDPSATVVPNAWLAALAENSVILDLAADPYHFDVSPAAVKAIEGIPHGDLDQYVFQPDDPAFDELEGVDTTNRRVTLSCYSWPGIEPRACMEVYGEQLEPILEAVLRTSGEWDGTSGSHYERAIARAEATRWAARETP